MPFLSCHLCFHFSRAASFLLALFCLLFSWHILTGQLAVSPIRTWRHWLCVSAIVCGEIWLPTINWCETVDSVSGVGMRRSYSNYAALGCIMVLYGCILKAKSSSAAWCRLYLCNLTGGMENKTVLKDCLKKVSANWLFLCWKLHEKMNTILIPVIMKLLLITNCWVCKVRSTQGVPAVWISKPASELQKSTNKHL